MITLISIILMTILMITHVVFTISYNRTLVPTFKQNWLELLLCIAIVLNVPIVLMNVSLSQFNIQSTVVMVSVVFISLLMRKVYILLRSKDVISKDDLYDIWRFNKYHIILSLIIMSINVFT